MGALLDPALTFAADIVDDLEHVRISNENRLRDGLGLPPGHPELAWLGALVETLARVEHEAVLNLQRRMRKHPLGPWGKAQRGVGEKQLARLLAAIGDPYVNSAKGEPRTVSALWKYCGLDVRDDGSIPRRRRGEQSRWSGNAKMRAFLIAESCVKQLDPQCRGGHSEVDVHPCSATPACACSPYRLVYDARRAHTAATHPDWTDGHSHNDGLRVTSKAILRDLWRAARDWHRS